MIIEKIIDRPQSLTSEEIDLIMSDYELWEMYEVSVVLADEYSQTPDVNVEEEWEKLRGHLVSKNAKKSWKRWWKYSAAAIIAVLISGIAVLRLGSRDNVSQDNPPMLSQNITSQDNESSKVDTDADEKLSESAGVAVKVEKKQLNNHDGEDLEEYVRIEEARIDNEVALLLSRIYEEEYAAGLDAMADMLLQQAERGDTCVINEIGMNLNHLTML